MFFGYQDGIRERRTGMRIWRIEQSDPASIRKAFPGHAKLRVTNDERNVQTQMT